MKSWEYYSENPHKLWNIGEVREEQEEKIAQLRLTADERERMLKGPFSPIVNERNKPYHEFAEQRKQEFWQDCREEIGYDDFLTEEGMKLLEQRAWDEGHSTGLPAVFDRLSDLSDFVLLMVLHSKTPNK